MRAPNPREAFGKQEEDTLLECINYYRSKKQDPPYDGKYQKLYEKKFITKMNQDGYACAVATGSIACYLAIKSLELPPKSTVLVSPVSDSSSLINILIAGLFPVIMDTEKDSYNIGLEQIEQAYSSDVRAVYVVHTYGNPVEIENIANFCKSKGIKLIEDCSQTPFAEVKTKQGIKYVGSFGDIAAFSTMYRKTLQSCSSGGIIYSNNSHLFNKAIEYSDRGRKKWSANYSPRDVGNIDVLGLNCNSNELSCAVAAASLDRIDETIKERRRLLSLIQKGLCKYREIFNVMKFEDSSSPFLVPITFLEDKEDCRQILFEEFDKQHIPYAKTYQSFAHHWQFTQEYLKESLWSKIKRKGKRRIYASNAENLRKRTFNLFLHEGYDDDYINYMLKCFEVLN